jgi:hypothetical protein
MKKNTRITCVETGKYTDVNLSTNEPWANDDTIDHAANMLLRREAEYNHDFVCISIEKLRSEICHALTNLTEHTGEYRTFEIKKI